MFTAAALFTAGNSFNCSDTEDAPARNTGQQLTGSALVRNHGWGSSTLL